MSLLFSDDDLCSIWPDQTHHSSFEQDDEVPKEIRAHDPSLHVLPGPHDPSFRRRRRPRRGFRVGGGQRWGSGIEFDQVEPLVRGRRRRRLRFRFILMSDVLRTIFLIDLGHIDDIQLIVHPLPARPLLLPPGLALQPAQCVLIRIKLPIPRFFPPTLVLPMHIPPQLDPLVRRVIPFIRLMDGPELDHPRFTGPRVGVREGVGGEGWDEEGGSVVGERGSEERGQGGEVPFEIEVGLDRSGWVSFG